MTLPPRNIDCRVSGLVINWPYGVLVLVACVFKEANDAISADNLYSGRCYIGFDGT